MKISDYVESQIKGLWGTDFDENGIPVIKTNNLTYEGNIDYSEICKRNITKEQAKEWYLRPGDLLIEKSGGTKTHSVGYVSYFEGEEDKYVCNNFILALRPKNTINSKFLFYQIQFKYESNQFSDCFNKTTGIQNLKVKDYLAKEIKIYTPEEQEKIVSELDTVRSIINKNKQILEKYEILIKSRFIEMFGDPVINEKKWEKVRLDSVADIKIGPFGSLLHQEDYITGGHALVNPSHIINGRICTDEKLTISDEKYTELSPYQLKKDDVVMGRRGEMGRCAVVVSDGLLCGTGSLIIRTNGELKSDFIQKIISFPSYKKTIEDKAVGQTMPNLNVPIVSSFEIIKPPKEVQGSYYSYVQQIDKSKFEMAIYY